MSAFHPLRKLVWYETFDGQKGQLNMPLDETTRRQLLEAQRTIMAQLDDLEVRWTGGRGGHWRLRAPEDAGDVYDQLKQELREIDELLGSDSSGAV